MSPFQNTHWLSTCEGFPSNCECSMRELVSWFSSFSGKLICKMSPIVLDEILGVFLNTLTADGMYPLRIDRKCNSQVKWTYLKNQKLFLDFLFHFWNLHQMLNILKKMMILTANVFRNYRLGKSWLDLSLNSAVSEHGLTVNMWKRSNYLQNLHESDFIMFFIILS